MKSNEIMIETAERNKSGLTLLLTATIEPRSTILVERSDPKLRLTDYRIAISRWLTEPAIGKIIFCENSGADLEQLHSIATRKNAHSQEVIFVSYTAPEEKGALGKGYGELDILSHLISQGILRGADHVLKVTGRYLIDNFDDVLADIRRYKDADIIAPAVHRRKLIPSECFYSTVDFLARYLVGKQPLLNDLEGFYFEHALAQAVAEAEQDGMTRAVFTEPPHIVGISGGANLPRGIRSVPSGIELKLSPDYLIFFQAVLRKFYQRGKRDVEGAGDSDSSKLLAKFTDESSANSTDVLTLVGLTHAEMRLLAAAIDECMRDPAGLTEQIGFSVTTVAKIARALGQELAGRVQPSSPGARLRPRLRNETILHPVKGGVYVRNDFESGVVYAETAYELLRRLSPHLTGEKSVSELCELFRGDLEKEIIGVIDFLYRNGLVTNVDDDAREEIFETVKVNFAPQIEFLSHCSAKPWGAFRDFQSARLLLVGAGLSFRTCAVALLQSGLKHLSVCPIAGDRNGDGLQEIIEAAASLRARGVGAQVSIVGAEAPDSLEEYGLIACCTDWPYLRELRAFERKSILHRRPFYPGIVIGDRGFIGPMTEPNSPGCWLCCLMRLADDYIEEGMRKNIARADLQSSLPFRPEFTPCGQLPRVIGSEIAFELFKTLAGDLRPEMRKHLQIYSAGKQGEILVDLAPHHPNGCLGMCRLLDRNRPPIQHHLYAAPY